MDHQFIFPKVSMIVCSTRSTGYHLSVIYQVVHGGSWCHAYTWFDDAHRHAAYFLDLIGRIDELT